MWKRGHGRLRSLLCQQRSSLCRLIAAPLKLSPTAEIALLKLKNFGKARVLRENELSRYTPQRAATLASKGGATRRANPTLSDVDTILSLICKIRELKNKSTL